MNIHRFTDTDADPYNSRRGLFFSHVGWLLVKKHPAVQGAGKKMDVSDLEADPVLKFQRDYYMILMPLTCFILPLIAPPLLWGESWKNAWFFGVCFRYVWGLNITWCVNSFAHYNGSKPYDKSISSAENIFVSAFALGEGNRRDDESQM